jgi:hypothetical protein
LYFSTVFCCGFCSVNQNKAYDIPLDLQGNFENYSSEVFFEILYGLEVILNMLDNDFADFLFCEQYFAWHFQTVYPIDASDMALESYGLGATFSC